jgi:hypothetical protein
MAKMLFYYKIFRDGLYSFKFFNIFFFNNDININSYKDIISNKFIRYFYIVIMQYQRLKFSLVNYQKLSILLRKLKKKFKKLRKKNIRSLKINHVITKLRYYDKFKDSNSPAVLNLYEKYIKNPYLKKCNLKNKKYIISLKNFLIKFKNQYKIKRIKKIFNNKYNIVYNNNFYQISKHYYNKIIEENYGLGLNFIDDTIDYIEENKTTIIPYNFFLEYHLSNKTNLYRAKYDLESLSNKNKFLSIKNKINSKNKIYFYKFYLKNKFKINKFNINLFTYKIRYLVNTIYKRRKFLIYQNLKIFKNS